MTRIGLALSAPRVLAAGLLIALVWGFVVPLRGWGDEGHRIVGRLAWLELSPEVRVGLRRLLPDPTYPTLAETATWADTYARRFDRYRWLEPYHYMNADPLADRIEWARDCADDACILGGIRSWSAALGDERTSDAQKVFALRMLAHLVGDIHQPLHVAHPDGSGGNATRVVFFGEPRTLHRVWDGSILARRLRELAAQADSPGAGWEQLALDLHASITDADRQRWRADLDPALWADESLALARDHAFGVRPGQHLGRDDYRGTLPVVEQRLGMAGVRLAALLTALLSHEGCAAD